jgi:para-aminobenzoate synthetase component 2
MRLLVVDNYDSFVYNLVQYLAQLGVDSEVLRNDTPELGPERLEETLGGYGGVLVSPGPSTPQRAGRSIAVIEACAGRNLPVLGVCLGHQAIGAAWGGIVEQAPELFTATRYHSLTVRRESVPAEFEITGWTDSGIVMAMRHRELPVEGVQFHPESVLTDGGHRMLANWLAVCGYEVPRPRVVELETEMRTLASAAHV